jgi:hypothetical protein
VRAQVLACAVDFQGVVLRDLGEYAGADQLDDLLGQSDRMHQLDQGPGIVTGLCGQLPAVLLDSLGGTQDADACFFRSVR